MQTIHKFKTYIDDDSNYGLYNSQQSNKTNRNKLPLLTSMSNH